MADTVRRTVELRTLLSLWTFAVSVGPVGGSVWLLLTLPTGMDFRPRDCLCAGDTSTEEIETGV